MLDVQSTSCCGLREIYNTRSVPPENFFAAFRKEMSSEDEAPLVYFFTDADDNITVRGDLVADLIKANGYGTVSRSRWKLNPNSGNKIRVYVWLLNDKARKELL